MAKIVVNPEAELPARPGDVELSAEQLAALAVFSVSIKKAPSFDKFPGTHVLRRYMPGEVICYQGEPGRSAFYMLTAEDLRAMSAAEADASAEAPTAAAPADAATETPATTAATSPAETAAPTKAALDPAAKLAAIRAAIKKKADGGEPAPAATPPAVTTEPAGPAESPPPAKPAPADAAAKLAAIRAGMTKKPAAGGPVGGDEVPPAAAPIQGSGGPAPQPTAPAKPTVDPAAKLAAIRAAAASKKSAADAAGATPSASPPPRQVATARLVVDAPVTAPSSPRSLWSRILHPASRWGATPQMAAPASIPIDGPADIDYQTRTAPIFAGEVFGEMSCLTRRPRSATIVADEECYALEFLRNVLDQMLRDPQYKARSDAKYRERVMEGHLRSLSLFRHLNPEQFQRAASRIELVDVAPGAVLWDEGDAADAAYVVRSGIVKVIQEYPWKLTASDILDWKGLVAALAAPTGAWEVVAKSITLPSGSLPREGRDQTSTGDPKSPERSAVVRREATGEGGSPADGESTGTSSPLPNPPDQGEGTGATEAPSRELQTAILAALNDLAKRKDLLLAKELADQRAAPTFTRETDAFGPKPKEWQDLETRRGNRVLLYVLAPRLIAAPQPLGITQVRRYVSRGGTLGEIGVSLDIPRSATCIAYSHPDPDRESTNVELVRVPGELLKELLDQSPEIRREFDQSINRMLAEDEQAGGTIQSNVHSHRAEELGLMQGQKLMLIDLDRCTRCGDCVEACIDTHDDGHSRLFLDGPRLGHYLVPSACRMCRDPVCMIGCPVGSIQQGANGEIVIRDWCIGCSLCADQCPYDSIQMHDLSIVPAGRFGWKWRSFSETPVPSPRWGGSKGSTGDPTSPERTRGSSCEATGRGDELAAETGSAGPTPSPALPTRGRESEDWRRPEYNDRDWPSASAPFQQGFQEESGKPKAESGGRASRLVPEPGVPLHYFRLRFLTAATGESTRDATLTITAHGGGATAWLDGRELVLTQDPKQAKRGEFEARVPANLLAEGEHLLAVSTTPPAGRSAVIFDACLEWLQAEQENVEVKSVSRQAVVCDQCASLSGGRAACVYACPHEAAMRIDAWIDLPAG